MKKKLILAVAENKDIFDKIKFRTKFEVSHAVWNPKISLIALGSLDGEVVVKRYLWKTGWKRNFSRDDSAKHFDFLDDVSSISSSSKSKDQLLFLCWSPDGQVLLTVFQSGFLYYLDTQTGNTLFVKKLSYSPFCVEWLKFRPTIALKFPRIGEQSSLTASVISNSTQNASSDCEHRNVCCAIEHFYRHILPNSLSSSFLCVLFSTTTETFVDIFSGGILLIRRLSINEATICRSLSNRQNEFLIYDEKIHILSRDSNSFEILRLPGEFGQDHLLIYEQIVDCFCWMSFCNVYRIAYDLQSTNKALMDCVILLRSLLVKLEELNESQKWGTISERLLDTLLKISADHPAFDPKEILDENCANLLNDFEKTFQVLNNYGIHSLIRQPINKNKCYVLASNEKEAIIQQIGHQTEENSEEETSDEEKMSEDENGSGHRDLENEPISLHSFIFGHSEQRITEERMEC
ncbi:hypothetical protein niasHT_007692 [Heterodera trifolii]|uniref:Anaphase-promoting complex subunit 4-like WD40 domain-containing protein n=1 Tax=Heterodera trifolii TaxID=157864 RepID=A0ABD2MA75_9BILA